MDLLWWFYDLRTPFLDTLFSWVTRFGEEMSLIAIFCLVFWCLNKKMAYVIGYAFFLSGLIVQGMKTIFRVPRPWVYDPTFQPVGGSIYASTGYAFPSGHTQTGVALLGSVGACVKTKWFRYTLYFLGFLVGFSRLYLGVHYIEDVLASFAITIAVIIFAKVLLGKKEKTSKQLLMGLSVLMILVAAAAIGYAIYLYHNNITTPAQLRDSTRVAGAAIGFAIGMYIEQTYINFSPGTKTILGQVVKMILGVVGLVAVQEGFRLIGTGLVMDSIRYFLVVMWAVVVYPLIIKKFFEKKPVHTDLYG